MNNRIIKFRAFNERLKKMITHDKISKSWNLYQFMNPSQYGCSELMQFTGLLDKNGKEIYEGDILKYGDKTFEVIFKDGCFWAISKSNTNWIHHLYDCEYMEIIGNIFEHPELLK